MQRKLKVCEQVKQIKERKIIKTEGRTKREHIGPDVPACNDHVKQYYSCTAECTIKNNYV